LDHTKSYVEKIHSIDAELVGYAHKLDMKPKSLCGNDCSVCCAHACQALQLRSELTNNTENKDGVHFFTLNFECHTVGITSHYCMILKIVILHDAIKIIQNGVFPFSSIKKQNLFSLKKTTKNGFERKTNKKEVGFFFWKKLFF